MTTNASAGADSQRISSWWWGTASSAVQTEGAAPADDWYRWEQAGHAPASDNGNGFVEQYQRDFGLLAGLGTTDHRLSVNWARIEPEEGRHDQAAIDHYRAVLTAAHEAGLRTWLCLLHTALPTWFADRGGFAADDALDIWLRWVDLAANLFGDLVDGWMPINNPTSHVVKGYMQGQFPPGHTDLGETMIVLKAMHIADHEAALRLKATGKPTCSNEALAPLYPADDSDEAKAVTSALDGVVWNSWLDLARQPRYREAFDFIGFSYYYAARADRTGQLLPHPAEGRVGPLGYVPSPDGIATVLDRLHRELPNARVVVAELGYGDTGTIADDDRCAYLERGIGHISAAARRGMNIEGVMFWTGVDNYEWLAGHDVRFGLFTTDRKPKRSAELIRDVIAGRR